MFKTTLFNPEDKLSDIRRWKKEEADEDERKRKETIKKWKQIFKY